MTFVKDRNRAGRPRLCQERKLGGMKMAQITARENYLRILRGEIPEYLPTMMEPCKEGAKDHLLTPIAAPDGPVYSPWGVRFVGSPDNNFGAMPEPGFIILDDITRWRDVIRNPDMSGFDWEAHYRDPEVFGEKDRVNKVIMTGGGDYFQTLVSFMGFENALLAMYEEPEEVMALFDYLSEYFLLVVKNAIYYTKPDVYMLADDTAAQQAPFFSPSMYRELLEPFYRRHTELALDAGMLIDHHNCGRCEDFIGEWLDMGICSWNPAQTCNDLKGIKEKYGDRLTMQGCWDNTGYISSLECSDEELTEALYDYVDTFAPGGRFVFMAGLHGERNDERFMRKQKLIDDFYRDYAKDWYKTH